jgi:hypothetical protein
MFAWPRYLGIILLWQISCSLFIAQLNATEIACPVEYWLISTRHLGCNNHADRSSELRYWQYQTATKSWESKTVTDWQATAATPTPTWFMIHGNRANHQESTNYGWNFSQQLLRYGAPTGPLRVVIWSWPSDQIHGALDDVRSKAARTPTESILLAQLISQLPSETPVSFVGHSFGARITTGTLHLLGRGSLQGYVLPAESAVPTKMQAALSASALHSTWLLPGAAHGNALSVAQQIVFINNSCDPALKRYRFIDCTKPSAVGYTGAQLTAAQQALVIQRDACSCLGKTHDYHDLYRSCSLMSDMRQALLTSSTTSATSVTIGQ